MNPRIAFRNFMKHTLEEMTNEGKIDLTEREIGTFILSVEDNYDFFEQFEHFLVDYIDMSLWND